MSNAWNRVKMIGNLVANDLKSRYSGSALGMVWAYVQPLMNLLVFWFVFQVGFRNPPIDDVEYILWFSAGYIPWTFFSDSVMSTTHVFYEYSYLVKKMKFDIWQLPVVKVLASFCIHLFFMLFIFALYLFYGYKPGLPWISVVYYSCAMVVLLLGMGFFVASFSVLLRDIGHMISILLQLGFWITPVFWSEKSMNSGILYFFAINPMYYIITGYRMALIDGINFWERTPGITCVFWGETVVFLALGIFTYRKLKDHFSDLL